MESSSWLQPHRLFPLPFSFPRRPLFRPVRFSGNFENRNGPRDGGRYGREDRRHRVVPSRVPRGEHPGLSAIAAAVQQSERRFEAAIRGSAEEAEALREGQRRRQRDRH